MNSSIDNISSIYDPRSKCFSILTEMTIEKYLELIEIAYKKNGGIEGQRTALKTKSAISIRERLVDDLTKGTVIPPIVLGYLVTSKSLGNETTKGELELILQEAINTSSPPKDLNQDTNDISKASSDQEELNTIVIIDGMQRTTAMYEAFKKQKNIKDNKVRVEFWLTNQSNSLIYRMLILNTGQVPWNLRQQIEVVNSPLIKEIKKQIPGIKLVQFNENERRNSAKQFQAKDIIDLYMAFGARNADFDSQETLSDQFTKLDFIESTANNNFNSIFYKLLKILCDIDELIFNLTDLAEAGKFTQGKDLFTSSSSRIGFITAAAIEILGYPGEELSDEEIEENRDRVLDKLQNFRNTIENKISSEEIKEYLAFETLNEVITGKTSGIGKFQRNGFKDAFRFLLESNKDFSKLNVCWRNIKR